MDRGIYFLFDFSRGFFFYKGEIVRGRTFGIGFGFKTVHFFGIFKVPVSFSISYNLEFQSQNPGKKKLKAIFVQHFHIVNVVYSKD